MASLWFSLSIFVCFFSFFAAAEQPITCSGIVPMPVRTDNISITDLGGVGDGVTLNTKAFQEAISRIQQSNASGGTILYIPAGVYLTERFNLTSRMTLYLAKNATIKATQDAENWPVIPSLPSYGRSKELPGGRYASFILGDGLCDVVITGENGTIDGQGELWWKIFKDKTLKHTRPNFIEFMNSQDIIISNVTLINSPQWNIHPVYCSNFVVRNVTILAPWESPNTDGVDPDSSSNVCIEDSYMSTGDDLVAVKSGWDEYGIAFGRPSTGITIRRLSGSCRFAGIAVGSENSGGVENVFAEHINLRNISLGIHIKTNIGRGGYIRNITVSNVNMNQVLNVAIRIAVGGAHPDDNYNRNALPIVDGITLKDIQGVQIRSAGLLQGLENSTFTGISLSNITLGGWDVESTPTWKCERVTGEAHLVSPAPSVNCSGISVDAHEVASWSN